MLIVDHPSSWPAVALWIILCVTDGIDGYLARRQGATRSGAFLDPLADKVLVLGAMIALVAAGEFWWLPVAIIVVREIAISVFRSFWGRRGLAVPATQWAKVKTVVQEVAVGFALLPLDRGPPMDRRHRAVGRSRAHRRDRHPLRAGRQSRDPHHRLVVGPVPAVRCEVVAVGTELLLGQIVDTNSAWIGEQLALAGIDVNYGTHGRRQPRADRQRAAHRARIATTPCSCAAASVRRRTTSPATRSPRSWASARAR